MSCDLMQCHVTYDTNGWSCILHMQIDFHCPPLLSLFPLSLPLLPLQVDIYTEYINPLVTSCLNGINCTVFAYGQTGSGKTYTLGSEGKSLYEGGAPEGIIPRALHDLFRYVKEGVVSSKDEGVASSERESCQLSVSYVEVYKEEIRDLLSDDDNEINIREDESGRTG